jgi:hypothetical protein
MTIIGTLDLRAWDAGCMKTLGAEIATYVVDGESRAIYVVEVPSVQSGLSQFNQRVPVFFDTPEDVYQEFVLPCFVFKRNDMTPAFDRQPWYGWVARAPAKGARKIVLENGRVGYDRYDNQWRATPFDITYDCVIYARRQQESVMMLMYALRHFIPPWFIFKVVDSLGDVREYDAGEMSISNTSELADIADRTVGWTIAFTVRGEIDLHDIREYPAMLEPDVTYARFKPERQEV